MQLSSGPPFKCRTLQNCILAIYWQVLTAFLGPPKSCPCLHPCPLTRLSSSATRPLDLLWVAHGVRPSPPGKVRWWGWCGVPKKLYLSSQCHHIIITLLVDFGEFIAFGHPQSFPDSTSLKTSMMSSQNDTKWLIIVCNRISLKPPFWSRVGVRCLYDSHLRRSGGVRDLRPLRGPLSPQPPGRAGRAARRGLPSLLAVVTGDVGARRCGQGRNGTTGGATGGGWSGRRHHWKLQMLGEARLTWNRLRTPGHITHRSCMSDRKGGCIDQDDDLAGLRHHGHLAQIRHLSSRCHCLDTERD